MKAHISIDSDMDFHIYSPIGFCHEHLSHRIDAETEEELRQKIVMFLAQLEIRLPYEQEYHPFRHGKHDADFKFTLYEAIHQIANGGSLNFGYGGNRTLSITSEFSPCEPNLGLT